MLLYPRAFFEAHWYALQAVVRTFPQFFFFSGYFRKCVARSEKLVYDYYGLWLGKPSPGQNTVTSKLKFIMVMVENIGGKGDNAGYEHFLIFPCFQNAHF